MLQKPALECFASNALCWVSTSVIHVREGSCWTLGSTTLDGLASAVAAAFLPYPSQVAVLELGPGLCPVISGLDLAVVFKISLSGENLWLLRPRWPCPCIACGSFFRTSGSPMRMSET